MLIKITIASIILVFSQLSLFAQQSSIDTTFIDSSTFQITREKINKLSTEPFEKHSYIEKSDTIPFRLLRPITQQKNVKYPLIITLHNSSRIGTDNEKQLEHLTRTWLRADIRNNYPCFVLAPQFNSRSSVYQVTDSITTAKPSDQAKRILNLIDQLLAQNPNIDSLKIYLVGYSMGGSTALNLISLRPQTFAAVIAIAAVPDFSNLKALKKKRIYLIHGRNDIDNPYKGSYALFSRLTGNKRLEFKTFQHLDHGTITIPFLSGTELAEWLFKN